MRQFLITILLFLLPLVVGYALLEKKLQKIPNSYNQKKWGIEKQLSEIEVLNVGSSSSLSGIDPEFFSHKGYNMANVTQTTYYDAQLIRYYADKLPRLKLVIIPVDYAFHRQLELINEEWRGYFYCYYWHIPMLHTSVFDIKKYSLLASYTPHTTWRMLKKKFNVTLAPVYFSNGFYKRDSAGHEKFINDSLGITREAYLSGHYSEENISKSKKYLEGSIHMLKARNIEVVLISTPFYHTLYDHFRPEILAANHEIINEMCQKYHCRYFDHMKDARFKMDDFNNCDHMDYSGAEKFSKIIDSEIIRPILK